MSDNTENFESRDVILVVDDQPNNLKVIATVLEKEYTLSIANNGINALRILEKVTPDLILLDIMMPGMDGFEVCQKIKANAATRHIPVIFLTAKSGTEDIVRAFDYGAVDFITKPFNLRELRVRVRNHLQFSKAKREIEQKNMEKDKFFSIIAHDLKSPFNAIIGFSTLLEDQIREKNMEGIELYGKIIQKSSLRAMELLQNLMDWVQSQTGRMVFNPGWSGIAELIEEVILPANDAAQQKNIVISKNLPAGVQVFMDREMIRIALRNLVSNAIKFTREGGTIRISAEPRDGGIWVEVADNGVGIAGSQLQNLFRLGGNFSTTGTNNEKGTGLGLIICKEFVEKHGGRLGAESVETLGSKFWMLLPGVRVVEENREGQPVGVLTLK